MTGPFIAVDWGTSSRRIYRIEEDRPVTTERDDRGAASLTANDYAVEVEAIRGRLGDLPIFLAGMVGSDVGWRKVPYLASPATLDDLAGALDWVDGRTAIVPGVRCETGGRVDVMRGEEVQLLGAAAAGLVPMDALLCQPGTHCKWVALSAGAITDFTTAMTGELFALISRHGLLARQLTSPVKVGPAFRAGVAEGARRDLPASLFSIRARGLSGMLDPADAASLASGMLIGADVAARLAQGGEVHVVSDKELAALYIAAIEELGGTAHFADSHAAFVSGMSRLRELAA